MNKFKYVNMELELAGLLSYPSLEMVTSQKGSDLFSNKVLVPKWARDNSDSFKLMIDYNVKVTYGVKKVYARSDLDSSIGVVMEHYGDHEDAYAAARYVVLMAVIDLLSTRGVH